MVTLREWNRLVRHLDTTHFNLIYGVGAEESVLPNNYNELDEAWYYCPECGELVRYAEHDDVIQYCPICDVDYYEPYEF